MLADRMVGLLEQKDMNRKMKKQTKKQKCSDLYDAFKCMRQGIPITRSRNKDGSISTCPVVEVMPLKEKEVLAQCITWFRIKDILCWRHDCGTFQNIRGDWGTYGMKGGGDIIGLLRNGRHFEVEVKKGKGGRLSEKQQERMRDVLRSNGLFFVVHGIQELKYFFERYI